MLINLSAMLLSSKEELSIVDVVCRQCDRGLKERAIVFIHCLASGLLVAAASPVSDSRCLRVARKLIIAVGD
jgi:hypothetical protein